MADEANESLACADDRADYRALIAEWPEIFRNPGPEGIQILLDEDEIRAVEAHASAALTARGRPADWARVGIAFRDQYLLIVRDAVRFPGGATATYIRHVSPPGSTPGVVILPRIGDLILLVHQFRHATRNWQLETPRGFGEPGQSPEENARRELREETGSEAARLVSLGGLYPDAGMDGGRVQLFFAEIDAYGQAQTDEGIGALRPTPIPEVEAFIRDGEIADAYTIAAFARARFAGLV